MRSFKNILVTGGAGFIGSHVIRHLLEVHADLHIVNLDALTYAGNIDNLSDLSDNSSKRHTFIEGNICDRELVNGLFQKHQFDGVIHLAAESHVDRSIENPMTFLETNIMGTAVLLDAALKVWAGEEKSKLFYHVSTDEVYGSLGEEGLFTETTAYDPRSPYSASKASSDHIVRAYHHTYGLPIVISNCSNNYGSHQHPEKLIPLMIEKIVEQQPLPIYGEGINVRDWLFVVDHARAIDSILHEGKIGETYNIGGLNEWRNIDLIKLIIKIVDAELGREEGSSEKLITFVKDRAGHDLRYAIDATKLCSEFNWKPSVTFEEGLLRTVKWYLN